MKTAMSKFCGFFVAIAVVGLIAGAAGPAFAQLDLSGGQYDLAAGGVLNMDQYTYAVFNASTFNYGGTYSGGVYTGGVSGLAGIQDAINVASDGQGWDVVGGIYSPALYNYVNVQGGSLPLSLNMYSNNDMGWDSIGSTNLDMLDGSGNPIAGDPNPNLAIVMITYQCDSFGHGKVDGADYSTWSGYSTAPPAIGAGEGDFYGQGYASGASYSQWSGLATANLPQLNLADPFNGIGSGGPAGVPEPSTFVLLLAAGTLIMFKGFRRLFSR